MRLVRERGGLRGLVRIPVAGPRVRNLWIWGKTEIFVAAFVRESSKSFGSRVECSWKE